MSVFSMDSASIRNYLIALLKRGHFGRAGNRET